MQVRFSSGLRSHGGPDLSVFPQGSLSCVRSACSLRSLGAAVERQVTALGIDQVDSAEDAVLLLSGLALEEPSKNPSKSEEGEHLPLRSNSRGELLLRQEPNSIALAGVRRRDLTQVRMLPVPSGPTLKSFHPKDLRNHRFGLLT